MTKYLAFITLMIAQISGAQEINPYTLIAKLESKVILKTKCGKDNYEYVYQFKAIQFDLEKHNGKTVGVVISCPEEFGENYFQKDAEYEMKVIIEERETFGNLIFAENSENVSWNGLYFLKNNSIKKL